MSMSTPAATPCALATMELLYTLTIHFWKLITKKLKLTNQNSCVLTCLITILLSQSKLIFQLFCIRASSKFYPYSSYETVSISTDLSINAGSSGLILDLSLISPLDVQKENACLWHSRDPVLSLSMKLVKNPNKNTYKK